MGTQVDTAEAFYVLMSGASAFVSEVTDTDGTINLYGPPGLPQGFTLRKALMYLRDGGPEDEYVPIEDHELSLYFYGREASEATAVYLAFRNFVRFKRHARLTVGGKTVIFQYAKRTAGPQDRTDPVEGWPFIYCSYILKFVELDVP